MSSTALFATSNTTSPSPTTSPQRLPAWLPSGFDTTHDAQNCVTPRSQLTSFAIYNCIAIGCFLLLGNTLTSVFKWLTKKSRARSIAHDQWSFWSALCTLSIQVAGILLSAWSIQRSGYQASMWDLVQLWALRPRVAWFIGNLGARVDRKWGYVNGALSAILTEIVICGLATVFLGRMVYAAIDYLIASRTAVQQSSQMAPLDWTWFVIVVASLAMLLSTGFEMVWALWMLRRSLGNKGRAEAQDMDSLWWIVRLMIPVTALSSWLIWIAFLYASQGVYCPATTKYINLIWGLSPVLANVCRALIDAFTGS